MSQQELVYLNGQLVPSNQASIAIYDAAVVLGATLTDMERTFNHQIFKLEQHIEDFIGPVNLPGLNQLNQKKKPKISLKSWSSITLSFLNQTRNLGVSNLFPQVNLKHTQVLLVRTRK